MTTIAKTKRLEILEASLIKKQELFAMKLSAHFDDVKSGNGQPMNDKRNGAATMNRWERQNNSLRSLKDSIHRTVDAIEREKFKIADSEGAKDNFPTLILELLANGTLIQWRKHPNTLFVSGVDKARIVWDDKKKQVAHRYSREITDKDQWKIFAQIFNQLSNAINNNKP